jgi:putative hemolysin
MCMNASVHRCCCLCLVLLFQSLCACQKALLRSVGQSIKTKVREAQRLRFDIFGTEMGARSVQPSCPAMTSICSTIYCEHLLVRDNPKLAK